MDRGVGLRGEGCIKAKVLAGDQPGSTEISGTRLTWLHHFAS